MIVSIGTPPTGVDLIAEAVSSSFTLQGLEHSPLEITARMRLSITITTRARRTYVEETGPGALHVWVTAPPHDGQANDALIAAVAAHLGVARSRVRIVRGQKHRVKLLEISDP